MLFKLHVPPAIRMTEEVVTSFISIVSEIFLSFVPTGFLWIGLIVYLSYSLSQLVFFCAWCHSFANMDGPHFPEDF